MPEVLDCTISGVFDVILGESMKATIVLSAHKNGQITESSIKAYCGKYLDSYKIPQIIQFEDRIVIAATGKKIK